MLEKYQLLKSYLAYVFAVSTLVVLIAYTVAKFSVMPYVGFIFNPSDGSVIRVFVENGSKADLQRGDKLIKVGAVDWSEFRSSNRKALFNKPPVGGTIEILVLREGQEKAISWSYPGPNRAEILDRLNSVLWLAYAFWLAGMATILLIRPRDLRWLLMVSFLLLTSVWLACGSISAWRIWESAILLRMAIWFCVPVYLHFHWFFPTPLRRLPGAVWWSMYMLSTILATLEWFEALPRSAYYFGFFLALLGSFGLLLYRRIALPQQRRDLRILVMAAAMALAPAFVLSLTGILDRYPWFGGLALIGLPLLPGAYFYTVYYRQIGGLKVRTNRLISLYVFCILIGLPSAALISLIFGRLTSLEAATFIGIAASVLIALASIAVFPLFQRLFEHRVMRIPLPPTHILSTYATRITTSLNIKSLKHVLEDEILPSLLIRQSALLQVDGHDQVSVLYSNGVNAIHTPTATDVSPLLDQSGKYQPVTILKTEQPFGWVRLALPLKIEDKLVGLWLLGNRDPDDLYLQTEISVLETIANHTAIALVNIAQADHLLMLYKSNIERQEVERASLARDLHDEILNQLGSLSASAAQHASPEFHESYNKVTSRIRQMVSDLRPAMLMYGLRFAIEELVDSLSERVGEDVSILLELPPSDIRYPTIIEENLYRMVQQACENSLRHAHPNCVRILGTLQPSKVALMVEDDGLGIRELKDLSLKQLLEAKHYGVVGMYERAALIGAELRIDQNHSSGTQISIIWHSSHEAPIA